MKMKYIIIPTIVFNLVCLSIFISRQYKKYHTRKSNYINNQRNRKYPLLY